MYIKLKNICTPEKADKMLKKLGIRGQFGSEKINDDWLKDINTNKDSYQAHLKPEGRDLTMDELKKTFKKDTEIGLIEFDLYFGRTPDEEMKAIAKFIQEQQGYIRYVKGSDLLIDRGEVTKDQQRILEMLEKKPLPLLKLPVDRNVDLPTSGQLLCKSFSPNPFWVLFGNVKEPKFMKNKIYVRDIHNNLHKDKDGLGFLLLPLCPIGTHSNFFEDVYTEAHSMGLREHPNYFLARVYSTALNFSPSVKEVAKEFNDYYTLPELIERFKDTFRSIVTAGYSYNNYSRQGFKYEKEFSMNGKRQNDSRIFVLNALTVALKTNSVASIDKLILEAGIKEKI